MLTSFQQLRQRLARSPARRLAVVCANDPHTLEAVMAATSDGLVRPILIGPVKETAELLHQMGHSTAALDLVQQEDPVRCAALAADLVRRDQADCVMKGRLETGVLMKPLLALRGGTMSAFGLFETPHCPRVFGITDMGLLIAPTLEQKRDMIRSAVAAFHALGVPNPKVAVVAAVEKANPKMPETMDAGALEQMAAAGQLPGCTVAGPLSVDLAMDPQAAGVKGYSGPIQGDADLLVMPGIAAGNIAAKLITTVGGGHTCGVMLGAAVPLVSLSRSAPADDKYMSIVLAALIGAAREG